MYQSQIIKEETFECEWNQLLYFDKQDQILIYASLEFNTSLDEISIYDYEHNDEIDVNIQQKCTIYLYCDGNLYEIDSMSISLYDKFRYSMPSKNGGAPLPRFSRLWNDKDFLPLIYPPDTYYDYCGTGTRKNNQLIIGGTDISDAVRFYYPNIEKCVGVNSGGNSLISPHESLIPQYNTPFFRFIRTYKEGTPDAASAWDYLDISYPFYVYIYQPIADIYSVDFYSIPNACIYSRKSYFGKEKLNIFYIPKLKTDWEGFEHDGFTGICYANGSLIDVSDPNFEYVKL